MRNREEARLSKALAHYLQLAKPRCTYTAIPNGGSRSLVEAVNLKRQGVIAGAGDWVFVWERGAGWIELKTAKGKLSEAQQTFRADCERLGVNYAVCRSLDECINTLRNWSVL